MQHIISDGGSVGLYMAHGGTNHGLWAGANVDGLGRFQPTVTSYDSDAPISETGALTDKFDAFRAVLAPHDGPLASGSPLRADPDVLVCDDPVLTGRGRLLESLIAAAPHPAILSAAPLTFEQLRQSSGLVLYTARPLVPDQGAQLLVDGLADRALVFVDGCPQGVLDRNFPLDGPWLDGPRRRIELQLVVENQGRINFGHHLGEGKGILGGVRLDHRLMNGWEHLGLPLDRMTPPLPVGDVRHSDPQLTTYSIEVAQVGDIHLERPGWYKVVVWVGEELIGRYWSIGPQRTLYIPAPFWKVGRNVITILEYERAGRTARLLRRPDLGPPQVYVETHTG